MTKTRLFRFVIPAMAIVFLVSCNSKPKEAEQPVEEPVAAAPVSARPVHWGYAGEDGPSNWATLPPVYALCGEGKGQSPINIDKASVKGDANWSFDYKTTSPENCT
ncbi:MAG: hypothetical protein U5K54_13740 [Cytophagales bacterium]|nr:hypothetical protein [Cytophagales bacterium]